MPRAAHLGDWITLFVLTMLWGTAFFFNELVLASFPPSVLVAGRIVIATTVLLVYMWGKGIKLPTQGGAWVPMIVLAILGNVLPFRLIAWAQNHIDSSLAGILMSVMPLFVLTLAHFFLPGSRLTPSRVTGFILGFAGVVLIIGPEALGGLSDNMTLWGALAALGAAFSYSVSSIYARRLGATDVVQLSAGMLLAASLISIPGAIADSSIVAVPGTAALLSLAVLGLLSTGLATLLYFRLVQGPGPAFLSIVNYLVPVVAVLAGALLLDESVSSSVFGGMALILSGIALSELGGRASRLLVGWRSAAQRTRIVRDEA